MRPRYTVVEGRCVDPGTSEPVAEGKIRLDVTATAVARCQSACDRDDSCLAFNFFQKTCSLISGVAPAEGDGDDAAGGSCSIKDTGAVRSGACVLSKYCG